MILLIVNYNTLTLYDQVLLYCGYLFSDLVRTPAAV